MPSPLQSAMPPDTRRPPPERTRERGAPLPVVDPYVRLDDAPSASGSGADALAPLRELLDRRGGCHLLRAVHVQADLPWEDALADVARVQGIARTPGSGGLPNGIVACTALAIDGIEARLDALARHPNVRGVRLPAGAAPPTGLAPLERRDLVLELRADTVPIGDVVWLASAHPDCRIVLDDAGARDESPGRDGAAPPGRVRGGAAADPPGPDLRPDDWHRLGPLDNVVLKLGYRDTPDPRHLGALVDRAIERFGADRVMLASGPPQTDRGRPRHERWHAFAAATRGIPASHRNALFRTNAVRTYRL